MSDDIESELKEIKQAIIDLRKAVQLLTEKYTPTNSLIPCERDGHDYMVVSDTEMRCRKCNDYKFI